MLIRTLRLGAAAFAAAGVVAAAAATPAAAMPTFAGVAHAKGGLTLRVGPSTHGEARGSIPAGTRFAIQCRVDATTVDGTTTWYSAPDYGPTWVSGRYVDVVGSGSVRYCGDGADHRVSTTATVWQREGTSTGDRAAGQLPKGSKVDAVCWTDGQQVGGTYRWYQLAGGAWVSGRYLAGTKAVPVCE